MDPAGYTYQGSNVHVSQDDATFVDAIHTSRGTNLLNGEFGMNQDVGHVDFYPNGGSDQPGCSTYLKGFMALIIRWNGWTIVGEELTFYILPLTSLEEYTTDVNSTYPLVPHKAKKAHQIKIDTKICSQYAGLILLKMNQNE